jgi:quercetin dioxygenase-like cupin family protein
VRCLITGIDDAGRSCVVRERDVVFAEIVPGLAVDGLFKTIDSPLPSRPDGRGDLVDLDIAPGQCSWSLWRFDSGGQVTVHHTDTVDFDMVVAGAVELVLDDGSHALDTGDCVVMTGVDHAWRAGAEGCVLSGIAIGTTPRE